MSVPSVFAAPASAHATVQQAAGVLTMSAGRLGAVVAALLAVVGVVAAGRALSRSRGRTGGGGGAGRSGAVLALVSGPAGMALGGLVAATASGGLGTGNGLGGAVVALLVGLVATVLGGLALTRSRRTG
ncbi:DUF6223 family protein [Kitasatospora sp. KL5]|uniref:DUF6223 family protein n=1 Tax=Kitasatospora sp. KL5 TaxID=3425125 RepID=UPI003D6EA085